ncbi:hypothetical protein [Desulfitobacterium sp. LBE]|uniref:hypothetical protein n=1 Tax=Desulfitobacterium sp. LBE TaxID=884086 RepID=UPI00119D63B7|nr:hypothetical protein [Desulfitobacterium sp. LBE]
MDKELWAYDITSISSYSEGLRQAHYGKNKEGDPLASLNLALVFGQTSNLRFTTASCLETKITMNLLAEFSIHGYPKVKLVMDRGFYNDAASTRCSKYI